MIRVGPAGWSYKDWEGVVYPGKPRFDPLAYLAEFFDAIEINSTFYRPARASSAWSWLSRVAHNAQFRFSVKLGQSFTHNRGNIDGSEIARWKEGIYPLQEEGRLGAVLAQFPWSFKNDSTARDYLASLLAVFSEFPLVVEVRHSSWRDPGFEGLLRHFGVGICNIDQPVIGRSLPLKAETSSSLGYFRYHGRNYKDWFRKEAGRNARYNYLYQGDEITAQADLVNSLQEKAKEVYVIYNNHFRGQAVVNALQLRLQLEGQLKRVPDLLRHAYPELCHWQLSR